ncbi:MAG: metallophosphoesterase [Nitrospirae bacterium]|nr:metallophosphoesterase [Nitrospirota bacterium]
MPEVTVLHLSDLHMGKAHLKAIEIILSALYYDLINLRDIESVKPDMVVFTGDLVNSGSNVDEFNLAESKFINPLMQILGLPNDRFFFTLGNHDIERDKLPKDIANSIRAKYTTTNALNGFLDGLDLKNDTVYFENTNNFRAFRDRLNNKHQAEANKLFSSYKIHIGGIDIGISCLNSAWLASSRDGDKGLLVGERQVDRVLEKIASCDVKMALMHHPLEWLVDFDREDVSNRLMKEFDFFFTGHMYQRKPQKIKSARGSFFLSDGGTLFPYDSKIYQGYTIIKIGYYKTSVYFRKYINSRREFTKDVDRAPDGYWEIPLANKKLLPDTNKAAPQPLQLHDIDIPLKSLLDDIQSRLRVPLYIPLTCANDILIHQSDTDLEYEVDKFLTDDQASVLLLLGDSGAGKSTFCARLFARLRDEYLKDGDAPLPVFIKLGPLYDGVKAGTFVDDELRRHGLGQLAISRLKQEKRVIFFLDGYDELGEKLPLFQRDCLNGWTDAKVIITCRSQHLSKSDEFHLFHRVDPLTNRPDLRGFRSLYITPLSYKQVDDYLEGFVKTLEAQWNTPEAYKKPILTIYNLRELSSNPLLLNIIVNTLPSLIKDGKDSTINRSRIYNELIMQWFEKERIRLESAERFYSGSVDIAHFFEFAEVLAFEMFIEGKIQIQLPKKRLYGRKKENEGLLYELLTSDDIEYVKFRSGCPIQRVKDDTFTFMHKSYQEYFIARRLQQDISENSKDALNKRSLTKEPAIINFLTEMEVDKSCLLNIVKESKTDSSIETAASNAATILNASRFCFSGHDLSGVRIPGADLSCAVLDGTDLSKADLRSVSFRKAFLGNTNLAESLMEDVEFGEMSYLQGHGDTVNSVAISADGLKIVSGSKDRTLRIWDMYTGSLINTLEGHSDSVHSVAISPDGMKIVSGSWDRTIRIWDMNTGSLINTLEGHIGSVTSIAINLDGTKIVSGSYDKTIRIWDMNTGSLINTLEGHIGSVTSIAVSPDGTKIVSGSEDKTIRIWDMNTGELINTLKEHVGSVCSVAITNDNKKIVSGSEDKTIRIWDMNTGKLINTLEEHGNFVSCITISADDKKIVSGSLDNMIRIWDLETGNLLYTLDGHSYYVSSVAISADSTKIVSGSGDDTIRIWDIENFSHIDIIKGHGYYVEGVTISSDGTKIVTGSADKAIRIWDTNTGRVINTLEGHSDAVFCVAISQDGMKIVSGSEDKTARIWDMKTGNLINTLKGHGKYVYCVTISQDGTKIVSGSADKTIRIWDTKTGTLINTLEGHTASVESVAISWDDKVIVSGSWDRTIRIWDTKTGTLINTLAGHGDHVYCVTISPDGTKIVSGSADKTIRIWDTKTGGLINTLEGHGGRVYSLAISLDGTKIVSGSGDKTVRIWDMKTGSLINTLEGHGDYVRGVAMSKDGKKIVSGSLDNSLKVWDAETGRLIWTTNPRLYCKGVRIDGVTGLSDINRLLLVQRGAVDGSLQGDTGG